MSGWVLSPASGGGPFLPSGGGTMTGAIILANVAGAITVPSPGASTTLISQNATGATNSGGWTFSTGTVVDGTSGSFSFTAGAESGTGTIGSFTADVLAYTFTSQRAATDALNGFTINYAATLGAATGTVFRIVSTNTAKNIFRILHNTSPDGTVLTMTNDAGTDTGILSCAGAELVIQTFQQVAASAAITIKTAASTGAASGALTLSTGVATAAVSGLISLTTGAPGVSSNSGAISLTTAAGGSTSGTGGAISATAGAAGGTGAGGGITLTTGTGGSTTGTGGAFAIVTGNGGTGTADAGAYTVTTGNGSTTGTGSRSGAMTFLTGNAGGSAARASGAISFTTGSPSATGNSGGFTFQTGSGGSASGASGGFTIQTGSTTSGTTGSLSFIVGTPTAGTTGDFLFSGARSFTLTGGGAPILSLINDDAGAGGGPDVLLYHNSASAAANDVMGRLQFDGNSATPTRRVMGRFQSVLITATNGAEDARMEWLNIAGGAENLAMILSAGGLLSLDLDGGVGTAAYPVLFDDFNDLELIRSVYTTDTERRAKGLHHWESLGLVTKKDSGSGWLLHMQPALSLAYGAIGQNRTAIDELRDENAMLRARVTALEARA